MEVGALANEDALVFGLRPPTARRHVRALPLPFDAAVTAHPP